MGLQHDSVNLEEEGGQISNENDTTLIYDLAALNTEGVQHGIANDERMKAAVARRITQEKMDAYIARRVQEYGLTCSATDRSRPCLASTSKEEEMKR